MHTIDPIPVTTEIRSAQVNGRTAIRTAPDGVGRASVEGYGEPRKGRKERGERLGRSD